MFEFRVSQRWTWRLGCYVVRRDIYRRFGGMYYLCFYNREVSHARCKHLADLCLMIASLWFVASLTLRPRRWRQTSNGLKGFTAQKEVLFVLLFMWGYYIHRPSGPPGLLTNVYRVLFSRGLRGRGVKLTTYLQLVLRSRKMKLQGGADKSLAL
jgi:hypothetical protein